MRVRFWSSTLTITAGNTITVKRYIRHEWSRADVNNGPHVIVEESMDPADGQKSVFFWAVNTLISENLWRAANQRERVGEAARMYLGVFAAFGRLDNIPVILDANWEGNKPGWISWGVSHGVLSVASALNWILGRPGLDASAVPKNVWYAWRNGDAKTK